MEFQESVDIQEALRCDNLLEKENINNTSQFLAPNPPPLPRATRNPLSAISNEAPALVNEVSPKHIGTKKQHLTLYDTNEVMVSYAASNKELELAFQELMKSKLETEKEKPTIKKRQFLMFLIKKRLVVQLAVKSLNTSRICEVNSSIFIHTLYNIFY